MIKKINITKLINLLVEKLEKTKLDLTKTMPQTIRTIVDTTETFAICFKDCFLQKNSINGFCFDRKK